MNQKELCQKCTEIDAIGDKVYVTWWDKGSDGTDTPLLRISDDRGQTFGDIIDYANATTANTANATTANTANATTANTANATTANTANATTANTANATTANTANATTANTANTPSS